MALPIRLTVVSKPAASTSSAVASKKPGLGESAFGRPGHVGGGDQGLGEDVLAGVAAQLGEVPAHPGSTSASISRWARRKDRLVQPGSSEVAAPVAPLQEPRAYRCRGTRIRQMTITGSWPAA